MNRLLKITWSTVLVLTMFLCGILISDFRESRIEEDIIALQFFITQFFENIEKFFIRR